MQVVPHIWAIEEGHLSDVPVVVEVEARRHRCVHRRGGGDTAVVHVRGGPVGKGFLGRLVRLQLSHREAVPNVVLLRPCEYVELDRHEVAVCVAAHVVVVLPPQVVVHVQAEELAHVLVAIPFRGVEASIRGVDQLHIGHAAKSAAPALQRIWGERLFREHDHCDVVLVRVGSQLLCQVLVPLHDVCLSGPCESHDCPPLLATRGGGIVSLRCPALVPMTRYETQ
mmetsp:Transcript_16418/g.36327  ORF Transcript_16418/g.36327 Transcript_16418/m.36327 type:complete len:225 (-) Transcript_16418:347-1021(-)